MENIRQTSLKKLLADGYILLRFSDYGGKTMDKKIIKESRKYGAWSVRKEEYTSKKARMEAARQLIGTGKYIYLDDSDL